MRVAHEFPLNGILVNVVLMVGEIFVIANSVIGEAALPDFAFATEDGSEGVRVSAFDQLNRMLKSYVLGRSQQKVDVFAHEDEGVKLIAAFAAISVESYEEKTNVVLDNEQSSALPCGESYEVGSGWGDESSRLQEQTSAAKAAIFA